MQPVLFTIPFVNLPVYGYGVMLGLAFVAGWYLTAYLAEWYGHKPENFYMAMTLAAIFSIVGARVFHILSNPDEGWTLWRMINLRQGGLVAYGGYIFGIGSGVIYWMYRKLNIWSHLDIATPCLALGLGLTRMGCFLRGCCYGVRTESAAGISFPPGSLVVEQHSHRGWHLLENGWSTPVFPTQLFESSWGFFLFALTLGLLILKRRNNRLATQAAENAEHREDVDVKQKTPRPADGIIFMSFVGLYSFFRFLIEFIRDDGGRGTVGPLSTSQFIGLILVGITVFFVVYWLPRHPFKETAEIPQSRAARRRKSSKQVKLKSKNKH